MKMRVFIKTLRKETFRMRKKEPEIMNMKTKLLGLLGPNKVVDCELLMIDEKNEHMNFLKD